MNYTKPAVAKLGQAVRVIEKTGSKLVHTFLDGVQPKISQPAYDLDE
jgi:hypothetical protein